MGPLKANKKMWLDIFLNNKHCHLVVMLQTVCVSPPSDSSLLTHLTGFLVPSSHSIQEAEASPPLLALSVLLAFSGD